jgi:hypothetical protein
VYDKKNYGKDCNYEKYEKISVQGANNPEKSSNLEQKSPLVLVM